MSSNVIESFVESSSSISRGGGDTRQLRRDQHNMIEKKLNKLTNDLFFGMTAKEYIDQNQKHKFLGDKV